MKRFWNEENFYKIILCVFFLICAGCGKKTEEKEVKTIKIHSTSSVNTLYYSGFIKPFHSINVTNNKAEGVITQIDFEYGHRVTKGQLLFVINSKQLAKDYQSALSDYVKAKKNYANVAYQMEGAEALKKLKIISEQEYLNTQSQMFNAELDTDQSERRLLEILQDTERTKGDIAKLKIDDPHVVQKALELAPEIIKIYAPVDGTALAPVSSGSSGGGGSGGQTKPTIGSISKVGEPLATIINESGVLVTIKATELEINKLEPGQKAIITGNAFPGVSLEGKIAHIDRTASTESSGGVPTFSVDVVYPQLTKSQDENIRVGMSVEVAIPFTTHSIIKIPLTAVFKEKGQPMVKKLDKKTDKFINQPVLTGKVDVDSIEILKGLNDGDEVLVHATPH